MSEESRFVWQVKMLDGTFVECHDVILQPAVEVIDATDDSGQPIQRELPMEAPFVVCTGVIVVLDSTGLSPVPISAGERVMGLKSRLIPWSQISHLDMFEAKKEETDVEPKSPDFD